MEWIVALLVVFGIGGIWAGVRERRKLTRMEGGIRNMADFNAADVFVSPHNHAGVAIDRNRHAILLADKEGNRIFPAASIVSCEVLEDGEQLAFANRGSQMLGVAVGGVLLGGVGAVIGGLSGSQRTVHRVHRVVLRFTTDDFDKPVHDVVVEKAISQKGMEKGDFVHREALKVAHKWHARTVAMMKATSSHVAPS